MKNFLALLLFTILASASEPLPLWPEAAPGALGKEPNDIPTITPYLPDSAIANGSAIVIFPGGGYGGLAAHEGKGYADWFVARGMAAFVVKYRLGSHGYRHPAMLQDAARSVRLVRSRAAEWKIHVDKIGVIGSSAGGHLASTLLTHFDSGIQQSPDLIERQSSRPNFGILCYPVISMGDITHLGSRRNLLGNEPSPELIKMLSNELQVTSNTPPCFIWHTWEDTAVKVENALEFATALQRARVPYDLHIYQKGGHGIGLGKNASHPWTRDCRFWLEENDFLPRQASQ
ncbi:MAG: alpha/beta hydrolase [Verrucomicrobiota bacterium]|nr:alpha/beta hydrolase [Verrucomicrobiota bacterium]